MGAGCQPLAPRHRADLPPHQVVDPERDLGRGGKRERHLGAGAERIRPHRIEALAHAASGRHRQRGGRARISGIAPGRDLVAVEVAVPVTVDPHPEPGAGRHAGEGELVAGRGQGQERGPGE